MTDPGGRGTHRRGIGLTTSEEDCGPQRAPLQRGESIRPDARTAVTVLLADDHPVVRRGLRRLLDAQEGVEVVAEAGDVSATVRKVRGYKPSILVLDFNMPGGSTLEAIPTFLEASPSTAIVVLTMQDEPETARAALRAGSSRTRSSPPSRRRRRARSMGSRIRSSRC